MSGRKNKTAWFAVYRVAGCVPAKTVRNRRNGGSLTAKKVTMILGIAAETTKKGSASSIFFGQAKAQKSPPTVRPMGREFFPETLNAEV